LALHSVHVNAETVLSRMTKYETQALVIWDDSKYLSFPKRKAMDNSNIAAYHIHINIKQLQGFIKQSTTMILLSSILSKHRPANNIKN
jgi:hypothetical protein